MNARTEFAAALVAQALGAAAVLLLATREWQTITTPRPRPFADDVLGVSGRTIDSAPTAFALVALAGVVAVIATKGLVRRGIGVVVALSGAAVVWRCAAAIASIDSARARELVHDKHARVTQSDDIVPTVADHPVWAVLSVVAGLLVVAAGLFVAWRGGRWVGLSARYERTPDVDPETQRARADASLWSALERGEDPTTHDPQDRH